LAFIKTLPNQIAQLKVLGIGGGGGNAINSMIEEGNIRGVDFIAINTDSQALLSSQAKIKIQIGEKVTRGLGAGGNPQIASESVEESTDRIRELLEGTDMVFITGGMGGGTCTGAAPKIAQITKDLGILTVAVVTKPFNFEGTRRMVTANEGIEKLEEHVDTLITIPNQKILEAVEKGATLKQAFRLADSILSRGVQSIAELITTPGLINLDFADIKSVMQNSGTALMGVGEAEGEKRTQLAIKEAISSPLLDTGINGAQGILLNITGGSDLTIHEVEEAANTITKDIETDANVIFGAIIDPVLEGKVKITVIATGFDQNRQNLQRMVRPSPSRFSPPPQDEEDEEDQDSRTQLAKQVQQAIEEKPSVKESALLKDREIPEGIDIESKLDIPSFLRKAQQ
jgi:cell division protein FtsZ